MQQNWNKIFENHDCLSEEQLLRYAQDQLDHKEKHLVERHLIDCDFCSAAVEGYQKGGNQKDINFLKDKISPTPKENKKKGSIIWMVAASVALLIGLFTIVNNNDDLNIPEQVAEHKAQESSTEERARKKEEKAFNDEQRQEELNNTDTTEFLAESPNIEIHQMEDFETAKMEVIEESDEEDFDSEGELELSIDNSIVESEFIQKEITTPNAGSVTIEERLEEAPEVTVSEPNLISADDVITLSDSDTFSNAPTNNEVLTTETKSKDKLSRLDKADAAKKKTKTSTKDTKRKTSVDKVKKEREKQNRSEKPLTRNNNETIVPEADKAYDESEEFAPLEEKETEEEVQKAEESASEEMKVVGNTQVELAQEVDASNLSFNIDEFDSLSPEDQDSIGLLLDEAQYKSEFEIGVEYYQKKNYQIAIEYLERTVKKNKYNYRAALYMGISYMEIKNYSKAIKMFDYILNNGPADIKEETQYNKAKCLIEDGKTEDAKDLLNELILKDGEYKAKAQELLDSLE